MSVRFLSRLLLRALAGTRSVNVFESLGLRPNFTPFAMARVRPSPVRYPMKLARIHAALKTRAEQSSRIEFKEFQQALAKIPADQREALILVGASGFEICGCAVGEPALAVFHFTFTLAVSNEIAQDREQPSRKIGTGLEGVDIG